jgi:IS5 family transposase
MDRNRLKGKEGDCINAILSAAGMNFSKLLRWAGDLLRLFFFWILSLYKPQCHFSQASK